MDTEITTLDTLVFDPQASIVIEESTGTRSLSAYEVQQAVSRVGHYRTTVNNLEAGISQVKDYLIENYEDLGDHAKEIAEFLGIELTREVSVDIHVTVTATLTIPADKDVSDLSYDLEFSLESTDSDVELEEYDINIDRVRES